MTMDEETRYAVALSHIATSHLSAAKRLYCELGSAQAVYDHRERLTEVVPECSPRLSALLQDWSEALLRADKEAAFIAANGINALPFNSACYPSRLRDCVDAPLVLYYRGTADLNAAHVVSIVGTRHCTAYGNDLIRRFVADLRTKCPDTLIVSGLAYGADVCAHKYALDNGMETVGVLAHGLDTLYPSAHRGIAQQMASQGGLLTEYMSASRLDKMNFVRRNRIVAGMSDATVVVESALRGGSLITADIAQNYGREVFAFPGAVGAEYSKGCNRLIRNNGATLITSADDFLESMGWADKTQRPQAVERQLFPELTEDERCIVEALQHTNDLQINMITTATNIPIGQVSALLFALEMKGVVRPMAGGTYHLLS